MTQGTIDQDKARETLTVEQYNELMSIDADMRKKMSPKGELGLPELLEAKRWEHAIPDSAFSEQCIFDRCHIWQVAQFKGEFYGGTGLYMPETAKARELQSNNRGILISAGPAALDALRSNGVDLGHLVSFIELSPYRERTDVAGGKEEHVIVLGASDITSSKELRDELRAGTKQIVPQEVNGRVYHMVLDHDGKPCVCRPLNPRSVGEE